MALALFVVVGLWFVQADNFKPFFPASGRGGIPAFLQATALMFVAYTGYGRIATLGEEVVHPRHTIPRAIIVTLVVTMILYLAVAFVGIGSFGSTSLSRAAIVEAAPLEEAARTFGLPLVPQLIAIGAITAMLGVLLNLLLGLSRVLMAMGRRQDMPPIVAQLNQAGTTPPLAVIVVAVAVALLVLIGNVIASVVPKAD